MKGIILMINIETRFAIIEDFLAIDVFDLVDNSLNAYAINTVIPGLQQRGTEVLY